MDADIICIDTPTHTLSLMKKSARVLIQYKECQKQTERERRDKECFLIFIHLVAMSRYAQLTHANFQKLIRISAWNYIQNHDEMVRNRRINVLGYLAL